MLPFLIFQVLNFSTTMSESVLKKILKPPYVDPSAWKGYQDVELVANNGIKYLVNSCVLAAASPLCQKLLMNANTTDDSHFCIMTEMTSAELRTFHTFVNTGKIFHYKNTSDLLKNKCVLSIFDYFGINLKSLNFSQCDGMASDKGRHVMSFTEDLLLQEWKKFKLQNLDQHVTRTRKWLKTFVTNLFSKHFNQEFPLDSSAEYNRALDTIVTRMDRLIQAFNKKRRCNKSKVCFSFCPFDSFIDSSVINEGHDAQVMEVKQDDLEMSIVVEENNALEKGEPCLSDMNPEVSDVKSHHPTESSLDKVTKEEDAAIAQTSLINETITQYVPKYRRHELSGPSACVYNDHATVDRKKVLEGIEPAVDISEGITIKIEVSRDQYEEGPISDWNQEDLPPIEEDVHDNLDDGMLDYI